MTVKYSKKFLKELSNIPSAHSDTIAHFVFNQLPNYHSVQEVGKIEKMKGYSKYYKIRFGKYRIGLKIHANELHILTIKHRKEIYNFFP